MRLGRGSACDLFGGVMEKQEAIVLIGPYKGERVEIINVEYGTGAKSGWFRVKTNTGKELLYAGEEIGVIHAIKQTT
jgi:hypothetical protein